MKRNLLMLSLVFAVGQAFAQTASSLSSPGDETMLTLSATGVQVYECRASASGALEWAFKEPRAELFAEGRPAGKHFAGPTWELADGSRIAARVAASAPAPRSGDIPWLRLTVTERSGSGALSPVTAVQRIKTQGGVMSGACPTGGALSEASYTADYVMIRAAP